MGCYDTVNVYGICPYCGKNQNFDGQTKDLGSLMYNYDAISLIPDALDRSKMPTFPRNPNNKEFMVWKSQKERTEANAKVPKEFKNLKYISLIATCNSLECQFDSDRDWILTQGTPSGFSRTFRFKLPIKKGKIIGKIYDIEKDNLTEKRLCRYKVKYRKKFNKLMKEYKHEPFVCRNWHKVN